MKRALFEERVDQRCGGVDPLIPSGEGEVAGGFDDRRSDDGGGQPGGEEELFTDAFGVGVSVGVAVAVGVSFWIVNDNALYSWVCLDVTLCVKEFSRGILISETKMCYYLPQNAGQPY